MWSRAAWFPDYEGKTLDLGVSLPFSCGFLILVPNRVDMRRISGGQRRFPPAHGIEEMAFLRVFPKPWKSFRELS